MSLITWNERFSIGITKIDAQHRSLADMVNKLHDAMTKGLGSQVIGQILNSLISYTQTHFSTEEELFARHDYPAAEDHKKEHKELVLKALEWKRQFDSGNRMLSVQISTVLRNWLVNHIEHSDKLYGRYLMLKGVR